MPFKCTPVPERFWKMVNKTDGCWLWIGGISKSGYGNFWSGGRNGKTVSAHRVSWELHNGPIPEGLWVLHGCDNPQCVRPDHLRLGTQSENITEMVGKGRNSLVMARLTEDQVIVIRDRAARGEPQAVLAREFGVSRSAIHLLVHGKKWKRVA